MASDLRARHLILDLVDVPKHVCLDLNAWEEALRGAATLMGMRILDSGAHLFEPPEEPGLTTFTLLDSSHFSVHTYSDRGIAAVDFFACTDRDLWAAWKFVAEALNLGTGRIGSSTYLDRFLDAPQ